MAAAPSDYKTATVRASPASRRALDNAEDGDITAAPLQFLSM
jgi:hypothetical protein